MLVKPIDLLGWHFNIVWLLLHLPAVTASHGRALPQHPVFADMTSHPVCPPLVYIGFQRGILTIFMELAARIELASFPYQGNIIPLYYASVVPTRGVEPLFRPCRERGLPLADAGSGRRDSNPQNLHDPNMAGYQIPLRPGLLFLRFLPVSLLFFRRPRRFRTLLGDLIVIKNRLLQSGGHPLETLF